MVPKQEIIIGDGLAVGSNKIPRPSEYLTFYSNKQDDWFRDTAIAILGIEEECAEGEDFERRIQDLTDKIFNFSGAVMDYSGSYSVKDEAFEKAYRDKFQLNSPDGLREFELIIPFENLVLNNESLSLSSDFKIWNNTKSYYEPLEVEFVELSEAELSGIMTYEGEHRYPRRAPQKISKYGLRRTIRASSHQNPNDRPGVEIGRRIATALRLFDPSRGSVGAKNAYFARPGWLDYWEDIRSIVKKQEPSREPPLSRDFFELSADDVSGFQKFWSQYSSEIRTDHNYDLSTVIRRYNETYVKHYFEDQLIDCAVALESMLLYGDGNPGTRLSRMKLRGSILLDNIFNKDRGRIRTLIDDIYEFRGDIVHQNEYLVDILEENERIDLLNNCTHPRQVISEARTLLGDVLRAYLSLRADGYSIAEVNELIDDSIQGTSLSI